MGSLFLGVPCMVNNRWCKSTVEECSIQPRVESKGVVGDCESEGSLRQISELRNTKIIRQSDMDEFT